jgi:hypothetical protein
MRAIEIDSLALRAPVAIDAEARLCVDEGRAVAAGAIFGIEKTFKANWESVCDCC